jgi:hypothetical protein
MASFSRRMRSSSAVHHFMKSASAWSSASSVCMSRSERRSSFAMVCGRLCSCWISAKEIGALGEGCDTGSAGGNHAFPLWTCDMFVSTAPARGSYICACSEARKEVLRTMPDESQSNPPLLWMD